jgi:hypothetical protein
MKPRADPRPGEPGLLLSVSVTSFVEVSWQSNACSGSLAAQLKPSLVLAACTNREISKTLYV